MYGVFEFQVCLSIDDASSVTNMILGFEIGSDRILNRLSVFGGHVRWVIYEVIIRFCNNRLALHVMCIEWACALMLDNSEGMADQVIMTRYSLVIHLEENNARLCVRHGMVWLNLSRDE